MIKKSDFDYLGHNQNMNFNKNVLQYTINYTNIYTCDQTKIKLLFKYLGFECKK